MERILERDWLLVFVSGRFIESSILPLLKSETFRLSTTIRSSCILTRSKIFEALIVVAPLMVGGAVQLLSAARLIELKLPSKSNIQTENQALDGML